MSDDLGSIIGTLIIVLFGAVIAFAVPALILKHGDPEELAKEELPVGKWLRILGSIVMIVGIIQVVLIIIL